jgi:hypothetical protein
MNDNRRSVVCLAGLAAAADVLLSSDDEGAHADRAGSYPRVRTTFVDATKYLSEVEFTLAFRMSPDCLTGCSTWIDITHPCGRVVS